MRKIDTHQHLALRDRFAYPWMEAASALAGDRHRLADYHAAAAGADIVGTVFVETNVADADAPAEAAAVLALAENPAHRILGVIAAARPEDVDFTAGLARMRHPALKGVRRCLHTQPDALSVSAAFRSGVALLAAHDFVFELCVLSRQLPLAIALADACPRTRFVLDHCGVPPIAGEGLDPWRAHLRELARRPHVVCKVSGLPAYCAPGQATADALRPYVEHAIECFGWERVLWGGDWPVCDLNGSLASWAAVAEALLSGESPARRAAFFHDNALRHYRLSPP